MNPLNNATIEIVEMSDKKGQYGLIKKIKGKNLETGQTNTYTVYDKKKDGSISAAWTQLADIQVGDTVSVGYAEQTGIMTDGKPFTSRIIRNFDKDLGNGRKNYTQSNPAPQAQSTPSEANLSSSVGLKARNDYDTPKLSQAEFSRRLGIQGHLNALLSNPGITVPYSEMIKHAILIEDQLEESLRPKSNIKVNSVEVQSVLDDEPPIESYDF